MSILDSATAILGTLRRRADGWSNPYTRVGGAKTQATQFYAKAPLSDPELDQWYMGDDIARRIVEAPVEHAMMLGFGVKDDEDGRAAKALRKWDAISKVTDAAIFGRLFGGAAILIGVRGQDPLSPLGEIPSGGLSYLEVIDKSEISPATYYDDPEDPRYGKPETYTITRSDNKGFAQAREPRIHESRLILFGGLRTTTKAKVRNDTWDYSILHPVYDVIRDFWNDWNGVHHLFSDLSQPVYHIKDLAEKLAAGRKDDLAARIGLIEYTRSMARAIMVDADEEDFTQVGAANISGVKGLTEALDQRLASAAGMPVTILMGMSPSGLNATGESDMRSWFNTVQAYREQKLTDPVRRLVEVISMSEGLGLDEPEIEWPSLWQMAPTEEADYRKTVIETTSGLVELGIISPEQAFQHFASGRFIADLSPFLKEEEAPEAEETDIVPEADIRSAEPEPAKEGLNGAQIKSMVDIATLVSTGDLERGSALGILSASFPSLSREQVLAILPPEGFTVEKPEPPPAFGAPPVPEETEEETEEDAPEGTEAPPAEEG